MYKLPSCIQMTNLVKHKEFEHISFDSFFVVLGNETVVNDDGLASEEIFYLSCNYAKNWKNH